MTIRIGSNVSSLQAQRALGAASARLGRSFERLSSGLRINRASDDAAGLAIADSLRADARIYSQGIRNLNDGISLLSIADGALVELSNISIRLKELAEQASNGVYTLSQRRPLDQEANALVAEFNRIVQVTQFNSVSLLESGQLSIALQAGVGAMSQLSMAVGGELAGAVGNGTFAAAVSYDGLTSDGTEKIISDVNGDGAVDILYSTALGDLGVYLGNGNGTFKAVVSYSRGTTTGATFGTYHTDLNYDGIKDVVRASDNTSEVAIWFGNSNGSFKAVATADITTINNAAFAVGDVNQDGKTDLITGSYTSTTVSVLLNNGDGTFKSAQTFTGPATSEAMALEDLNGDSVLDLIIPHYGAPTSAVSILFGLGNGTFGNATSFALTDQNSDALAVKDLNHDGYADLVVASQQPDGVGEIDVLLGYGNGTFKTPFSLGITGGSNPSIQDLQVEDYNGDGIPDLFAVDYINARFHLFSGNGDGTFRAANSFATGGGASVTDMFEVADVNGDNVLDVIADAGIRMTILLGSSTEVTQIGKQYLLSQEGARESLTETGQILDRVNFERGAIGAYQSRIQSATNNLQSLRENYLIAESAIRDVDVAIEVADMVRNQILQQAAAAILAQANAQPEIVLQLLRTKN